MDDGGIFMTATPGATNPTFVSLNNGIGSMTFYPGFGITNSGGTLVGAQDHGTQIGTGSLSWIYAGGGNVCGDGGQMAIDSAGVYAYAHCQGSPLSSWMSSATAGAVQGQAYPYGWVSAQAGITLADRTSFVPPLATDPSNAPNVYTGTYRVYQSTNHAANWTAISGDLTAGQSNLNTLAVAPTNANVVYAGAGDGTISVTTNALQGASATWSKLTGLPQRSITKIFVAPDSAQDVYVTVSGFGNRTYFPLDQWRYDLDKHLWQSAEHPGKQRCGGPQPAEYDLPGNRYGSIRDLQRGHGLGGAGSKLAKCGRSGRTDRRGDTAAADRNPWPRRMGFDAPIERLCGFDESRGVRGSTD